MSVNIPKSNEENKNKGQGSIKKTLASAIAALTILTTWCDNKPKSINYEQTYVETHDKEQLIWNYLKEFKKDYPIFFTKVALEKEKQLALKEKKLVNDIVWILFVNYPNIYNKAVIVDLPADIDLLLNETLKNIPWIKFNTSLNISPNWPADKQQIPTVDYTRFFQIYDLLKKWELWKYNLSADKYTYFEEKTDETDEYRLNPLVVMYDYDRFPTNVKNTDHMFVNSYYLEEEDFLDPYDFDWEVSRDKLIVFTASPMNEDLKKYLDELKDKWVPVDLYEVDLKNLSIKNAEKLEEIKKYVENKISKDNNSTIHHSSGWAWWIWYYMLRNQNRSNIPSVIIWTRKNINEVKSRNFPARFRWISIKWSAIRWAWAGKWFSARWWLW